MLRTLPMWFGIEDALLMYARDSAPMPTFALTEGADLREFYARRGFTPVEIFPTLWDPHNPALQCIKVLAAG